MRPPLRFLIAAFPLVLAGCSFPILISGPAPAVSTPGTPQAARVTVPPDATATPTPFQPDFPFAVTGIPTDTVGLTPGPGDRPVWGDYPGPSVNPSVPIPPPVGVIPQPEGQVNFLLLGSDQRPHGGGFRTDTMLLLTINPNDGSANLTSFPRDLYVYIPGWTMQRINTAQAHGGFSQTQLTFEYNLGVRPDHYLMINFSGFSDIVDNLGGINVQVAQTLSDHRDSYGTYTVPAGTVHMDGETALWYVRSRYSTSDFDRTRRQQEVILALFYRLLSLDAVAKAPTLYDLYRQHVTLDFTLQDLLPFLPLATQIGDTDNITRYYIGRDQVTSFRTPGGAAVLLPRQDAVVEVMQEALNSP